MALITGNSYNQIQQNIGPYGDTRTFVLSHDLTGVVNSDVIRMGVVHGDLYITSVKCASDLNGIELHPGWRLVDGSQSDEDAFGQWALGSPNWAETLPLPVKTTDLGSSPGDLRGGFEFTASIIAMDEPPAGKVLYLIVQAKVL